MASCDNCGKRTESAPAGRKAAESAAADAEPVAPMRKSDSQADTNAAATMEGRPCEVKFLEALGTELG